MVRKFRVPMIIGSVWNNCFLLSRDKITNGAQGKTSLQRWHVLQESSSGSIIQVPAAIYVLRSEKSKTCPIKSVGGVRFESTEGVVIIFRAVCNIGSPFVHRRCAGGFSASPLRSCGFHAMPVVASIYHCYWSVWTDCGVVKAAVVACRETTKRRKRKSVTWSGDIL